MARRGAGPRPVKSRWTPAGSPMKSARCCPRTPWWSRKPSPIAWPCIAISTISSRDPSSPVASAVWEPGLATALGVKAANPKRPVICLIGDGSFNYDPAPAAFGAAQEHNLPFLTIMFNNQGYLSQKSGIPKYYPDGWAVKSKNFSGLAYRPLSGIFADDESLRRLRRESRRTRLKCAKPSSAACAPSPAGNRRCIDVRLKPVEQIVERGRRIASCKIVGFDAGSRFSVPRSPAS